MAQYDITYRCGHTGTLSLIGPQSSRDYILSREKSNPCPDCLKAQRQKEREAEFAIAQEKAQEMELPDLIGTEKQITWAVTLRQKMIDILEERISKALEMDEAVKAVEDAAAFLQWLLKNYKTAAFYIERFGKQHDINAGIKKLVLDMMPVFEEQRNAQPATETEDTTLYPENQIHKIPVAISLEKNTIKVISPRNDELRNLVKSLKYTWDYNVNAWTRDIIGRNGTPVDRAAELTHKLLAAGFAVDVTDADVRSKAVAGDYKPECFNWITLATSGEYKGRLYISWEDYNDRLRSLAKSLPTARRAGYDVVVRIEHWAEVCDFAKLNGFAISKAAQDAIDAYKAKSAAANRITPPPVKEREVVDGLADILKTADEGVLDDLKDDAI